MPGVEQARRWYRHFVFEVSEKHDVPFLAGFQLNGCTPKKTKPQGMHDRRLNPSILSGPRCAILSWLRYLSAVFLEGIGNGRRALPSRNSLVSLIIIVAQAVQDKPEAAAPVAPKKPAAPAMFDPLMGGSSADSDPLGGSGTRHHSSALQARDPRHGASICAQASCRMTRSAEGDRRQHKGRQTRTGSTWKSSRTVEIANPTGAPRRRQSS